MTTLACEASVDVVVVVGTGVAGLTAARALAAAGLDVLVITKAGADDANTDLGAGRRGRGPERGRRTRPRRHRRHAHPGHPGGGCRAGRPGRGHHDPQRRRRRGRAAARRRGASSMPAAGRPVAAHPGGRPPRGPGDPRRRGRHRRGDRTGPAGRASDLPALLTEHLVVGRGARRRPAERRGHGARRRRRRSV